jgi:hypothetical protein
VDEYGPKFSRCQISIEKTQITSHLAAAIESPDLWYGRAFLCMPTSLRAKNCHIDLKTFHKGKDFE